RRATSVPAAQNSVEEFRMSVSNPNSDLTRASGGQMTLVGYHGSNTMHGSGYGFFQNSVLNSNTWDNNAAKVAKPDISDKRYGGRWGGALKKDRTFLFANYEARDFDQVGQTSRTVPTDSLKAGILRFRDGAGNITFNGSYTYFRRIAFGIGDISVKDQVSVVQTPQRGTLMTGSLTQNIKPNLINVTRFGFVRDVGPNQATSPTLAASLLNIPG